MQILINIDEEDYNNLIEQSKKYPPDMFTKIQNNIINGTPLSAHDEKTGKWLDRMTNGDVIKAIFPDIEIEQIEDIIDVYGMSKCRVTYDTDWWNAPYKTERNVEEKNETDSD